MGAWQCPSTDLAVQCGPASFSSTALRHWLAQGCTTFPPIRQGFAALLSQPDGSAVLAVSNRWEISVLYAETPAGWVIGTHPRDVIEALPTPPPLSLEALADLVALHDEPDTTVFTGVRRVPLGHLVRFAPGTDPVVERWFRPDTDEDHSIGPAEAPALMRAAVRDAVAASLPDAGPIAATLSGGLDSSMVVSTAAAALRGSGRRIAAYTHVPLPGTPDPSAVYEADDGPYARATAAHVGGIDLHELVNTARELPLDTTQAAIEASWQPPFNPINLTWIVGALDGAASVGSPVLLTGSSGNATFSRERDGIVRELAAQHRWRAIVADIRAQHRAGIPRSFTLRTTARDVTPERVLAQWHRLRRRVDLDALVPSQHDLPFRDELISDAARAELPSMSAGFRPRRRDFLDFVRWDGFRLGWVQNLTPDVWWSDPLSDPEVVALALRLPEEAWLAGGRDRGLAREALAGQVPDVVRLRHAHGAQGADTGTITRPHVDRYRAVLERIRSSTTASTVIDTDRLEASLGAPFHDPRTVLQWQGVYGRAFGLGQFICWYEDEVLSR
ncbi:MAG TPA: asparagine synthase-related protein [Nocardioides sp.]|nr:asparagine synthase-related protein [Nocardioides sp.]